MNDKTMILSSTKDGKEKAVLNIEKTNDGFRGNIRLFNFSSEPQGILSLAFLQNGEVLKTALFESDKNFYSFSAEAQLTLENFSCALVLIKGGNATPLLFGSTDKKESALTSSFLKTMPLLNKTNLSIDEATSALDEAKIDFDDNEKEEIENEIDKNLFTTEKCASCRYRKAFYENNSKSEGVQQINFIDPCEEICAKSAGFYNEIKSQLSLLFEKYPEETFLNEIIANSKWAKVDYEDNGQYFVVGLIYENNKVSYVCYGMPGEYSENPPKELNGICQWLPLDPEKPNELGYWIMYQDAETGENVEIKVG